MLISWAGAEYGVRLHLFAALAGNAASVCSCSLEIARPLDLVRASLAPTAAIIVSRITKLSIIYMDHVCP